MAKNHVPKTLGENCFTPSSKMHPAVKEEPVTPEVFGCGSFDLDHSFDEDYSGMKKSLSLNDIAALREDLMRLEVQFNKEQEYQRYRRPPEVTSGVPQELSRTKFVSMAPGRFHSTRPQPFRHQSKTGSTGLTVPQSPMLLSKKRSRPPHVMSQKEKEELELEEIRKHKIKAHPIPKSVIEGPHLPIVPKKPMTIPEPFKLTEIKKKPLAPEPPLLFKARPAPKHILEKPHVLPKLPIQVTMPVSPKFHYKGSKSQEHINLDNDIKVKPKPVEKPRQGPIRPLPFSFEKRDEELKRRRDEKIKCLIEKERKQASMFKAQPLPGMVRKAMHLVTEKVHKESSSTSSSENKENNFKFEARPAVVLHKEPFKPVLKPVQIVKPAPFALTTTKRAAEREKFDKQLKEKEEEQERQRLEREKEMEKIEEKINMELRAKLVHQPKPMPDASPFIPDKSEIPLTIPETPKFIRRTKKE